MTDCVALVVLATILRFNYKQGMCTARYVYNVGGCCLPHVIHVTRQRFTRVGLLLRLAVLSSKAVIFLFGLIYFLVRKNGLSWFTNRGLVHPGQGSEHLYPVPFLPFLIFCIFPVDRFNYHDCEVVDGMIH